VYENEKNENCWKYSRNLGGGEIKENDRGCEFDYDILQELWQMSQCAPGTTIILKKKLKN
jgi:hypothetical protein